MARLNSNAQVVALLAQRIAGLQKYGAALGPQILIKRQIFSVAQLLAIYTACVTDRSQIASARGGLQILVAQQTKDDAAQAAVDQGFKAALVAKYGEKSQELTDCGFVKTPKKPTVQMKVAAVEQSANTRKVRHTMSKKAREAIKAPPVTAQAAQAPASPPAGSTPTKS